MRLAPVLLCLFVPLATLADIIHLADGTTREGKVVRVDEKEVIVEFGQGSVSLQMRLPREQVLKIEKKPTSGAALMAEYVARLNKAMRGTADDWYALAMWCRQQRCLNDKAREALMRTLALDPDHEGAHKALGHVKLNDSWMTREQAIRLLAPDLDEKLEATRLELLRQVEEAKAQALEAQRQNEELKARLAKLEKENDRLRRLLAQRPPPSVYRPVIIIQRPPPHPHEKKREEK